jgi:arginine exporter protein ArgO
VVLLAAALLSALGAWQQMFISQQTLNRQHMLNNCGASLCIGRDAGHGRYIGTSGYELRYFS